MSYSVNAHYEILINGKWHYYGEGQFGNHVDFINAYSEWVLENGRRDTPDDVTKTTQLHVEKNEDPKAYASWLTSEEYPGLMSKLTPEKTTGQGAFYHGDIRFFYSRFEHWNSKPEDRPEGVEDFRVIMWLDY